MGGGAMWRSVIRVVGSTPTSAASNAAMCRMCTTAPSLKAPSSARVSCNCPTEVHHPSNQVNSGLKQYWDIEDWEFAGDEERDHLVFGTLPSQHEVEEAASDLQNALRIGLIAGNSSSQVESPRAASSSSVDGKEVAVTTLLKEVDYHVDEQVTEVDWIEPAPIQVASLSSVTDVGGRGAMLEAFQQFQHNPQVQKMVVSLATDKGVWDAVLANEQIQEFRHALRTGTTSGPMEIVADSTDDNQSGSPRGNINIFSQLYWNTKNAFTHFMSTLQELISGIFDVAEQKVQLSESDEFFERTVRSSMMLAVLVLSLVVFKRSAIHGA